jgi:hypothetical protein
MALCSQLFGVVRGAPPLQKLYPFYTLRGIAFGRVFAYSNFQENSLNIEAGGEAGLVPESIIGTPIAIAPVIGTARVVSAAGHIVKAFELAEHAQ